MNDIKREMRQRARLTRGLTNALGHDADFICSDVDSFDLICMDESIKEMKHTIEKLVDNITELEYLAYLLRQQSSQKKHTLL